MQKHPFENAFISLEDDNFHTLSDNIWETETSWFSFNIPERNLCGWLYGWVRPNMNTCGGGVFVYDDSAVNPWELPYFNYQQSQPLPAERDLRDFTFPDNYSIKMLEPLKRYALTYRDREHIALDLEFDGIAPPHPFPQGEEPFRTSPHFDQAGHVTGTLLLNGETLAVDCYATRDRSWGPRLDHKGNRIGYSIGTASAQDSFCVFALPTQLDAEGWEAIHHGHLVRDGVLGTITSGRRKVERDPHTNFIQRIIIDAKDDAGRSCYLVGEAKSRMMILVPRGPTLNTFIHWTLDNGVECYGEDQDVWRRDQWRAAIQEKKDLSNE